MNHHDSDLLVRSAFFAIWAVLATLIFVYGNAP